jgi:hypothetical protein
VMHSTAPQPGVRPNRDEVQDLEEGDLWDPRKPGLPPRRRRSTVSESPEDVLYEDLRRHAGTLQEDADTSEIFFVRHRH